MRLFAVSLALSLCAAAPALAQTGHGRQAGAIEFTTRIRPTVGRSEPARKLPFHLLRKSFADIRKEAEETEPPIDFEKFVDSLPVSKELRDWMKRKRTVQLTGGDFAKKATVDDVFDVPEFFEAYIIQNAGDVNFPSPKYSDRDREKDPEKYEKQRQEYREHLRRFAAQNPHTMTGIEIHLTGVDAGQKWARLEHDRRNRVRHRGLDLALSKYLLARTETDLAGRGSLVNIPPGEYWLSSLDVDAPAGDVRLRWDVPVEVRAGQTTSVELSNFNAVEGSGARD